MFDLDIENLNLSDLIPIFEGMGLNVVLDDDGDLIFKKDTIHILTKNKEKKFLKLYCFVRFERGDLPNNKLSMFINKLNNITNIVKFSLFKNDISNEPSLYCEAYLPASGVIDEQFAKNYFELCLEEIDKAKSYSKFINEIMSGSDKD